MNYEWLDTYCLAKKGVTKDFKIEWDAFRFFIDDKMFIMLGSDKNKKPIITLKCEPIVSDQYLNGSVPDKLIVELIDHSYELVVSKLPKKAQSELKGD